jgi:hypothetical protein
MVSGRLKPQNGFLFKVATAAQPPYLHRGKANGFLGND